MHACIELEIEGKQVVKVPEAVDGDTSTVTKVIWHAQESTLRIVYGHQAKHVN